MSDGEPQSKKPEDSDFQQQRLKAWQPLLTPKWVIATFILIGVVFIPIGIAIVLSSAKVHEVEVRYDNTGDGGVPGAYPSTCVNRNPPGCSGQSRPNDNNGDVGCTLTDIDYLKDYNVPTAAQTIANVAQCSYPTTITLSEDMDAPVYMYYKLSNFYQNHRRYVKSRSDTQLADASSVDTSTCDPWSKVPEGSVDAGKPLYPCGLIAGSFFVDRFDVQVNRPGVTAPVVDGKWWLESSDYQKEGIAWKSDKEDKFKSNDKNYASSEFGHKGILGVKLPPVNDEDFIVWMRTAGLPTFKKLYRKINVDLKAGDVITVQTLNYYPVEAFSGQKAIVFSTTSWLGGKNSFLGWAYIVVGIICFVLAIAFAIKHAVSPRPLGDMRAFNWPAPVRQ